MTAAAKPRSRSAMQRIARALKNIRLAEGGHEKPADGMCVMEAVAWLNDEPFNDAPRCVAPTIRKFLIGVNDSLPDDLRQQLVPLIPVVMSTNTGKETHERTRAYLAADFAVRTVLPILFDHIATVRTEPLFREWAVRLGALPAIVDSDSAKNGRKAISEARSRLPFFVYAAAYAATAADAAADAAAAAYADADDAAAARRLMQEKILPHAIALVEAMAKVGR